MKNIFTLLSVLFIASISNAQIVTIPDAIFKSLLLSANTNNTIAKNLANQYFKIDANADGEIQVSEALQVKELLISQSDAVSLTGLAAFTNIENLHCEFSSVTSVDVTPLVNIKRFYFRYTPLASVAISNLPELEEIHILTTLALTQLNLSGLPSLKSLSIGENQLTALDLSQVPSLQELWCTNDEIQSLDLTNLPNLLRADVSNQQLISLNVVGLTSLQSLTCNNNHITDLDLTGLTQLNWLAFNYNPLGSIDLSGLNALSMLQVCGDNLTALDLTPVPNVTDIYCYDNALTSIDLSPVPNLLWLGCSQNNIAALDLSDVPNLSALVVEECPIVSIDASMLSQLSYVVIKNNPLLEIINLKNGIVEAGEVVLNNNPSLLHVCGDDGQLATLQSYFTLLGQTAVSVNSYCSFAPGGANYTVQGNIRFDAQNNGCDPTDIAVPYQFFNISGASGSGSLISNTYGAYILGVTNGTHTMTPVLENPQYFSLNPTSATFTFPGSANPALRDYCVTALGTHNDLEVIIIPITGAAPGFTQRFVIKYKNKGNTVLSGALTFGYLEAFSDFVSATPLPATQTDGQISWDFVNLNPFESREITLSLQHNTPTDDPALNSGDILNFTATINPLENDETPEDNTATLIQTVVNSLDPNDKTCLEGLVVAPEIAGKYVHYLIRFENTGTAPAQNIVVKDIIDTSKFVVGSLIPLASSHPFYTKISGTNKAEFIFEGINLPFDDANNDGYIAFKIKTKPTLTVGDTFGNAASIYFDFNLPIVTNTPTTTIALLDTQDFDRQEHFSLYPNPVKNVLKIQSSHGKLPVSFKIYNVVGQLLLSSANENGIETIDTSALANGTFIIELANEAGASQLKFIKI